MTTVKAGAELLTVSVKLTATYWSATRPSNTVLNLSPPTTTMCLHTLYTSHTDSNNIKFV